LDGERLVETVVPLHLLDEMFGHSFLVKERPSRGEAGEKKSDRDDAEQREERLQEAGDDVTKRFH
jgi:hypothetical protein